MKLNKIVLAIAVLGGVVTMPAAWAQEESLVKISGFGTLSAVRTDTDAIGYRVGQQPTNSIKPNDWSLTPDSLLGVQLDIAQKSDLSATVQVVSRHRTTNAIEPTFDWAFVKYQFNPQWRVRIGRVLTPALMDSEFRYVGYANVYARPNNDLYPIYPLNNHDGIDLNYQGPLAGGVFNVSGFAGTSKYKVPANADGSLDYSYEVKNLGGVRIGWETDGLTLSAGYTSLTSIGLIGSGTAALLQVRDAAQTAVTNFGAQCPSCINPVNSISNSVSSSAGVLKLSDLGVRYSLDDWGFWGEYIRTEVGEGLVNAGESYVVGVNKVINSWTPYLTLSRQSTTLMAAKTVNAAEIAAIPIPALRAALTGYNSGIVPVDTSRHSFAAGTRWDFAKNMAFKGELSHVVLDVTTNPLIYPRVAGTARPDSFNLITLALDFVF